MAASRRLTLAGWWAAAGTGLLAVALGMAPARADTAAGAASTALAPQCSAAAHIDSQWGTGASGGQVLTVTVANPSTATSTTWTVSWTLTAGQSVVNGWNATIGTSGAVVTAVNLAYNGTLAAGASTSFGVQLSGTGPAPTTSCASIAVAPTSPPPPSGATITVTEANNQSTITMRVGDTLAVALGADFDPLSATGSSLMQLSTSGGYPTGQTLAANYRAVAPGSTDLRTQTDYPCFHTVPRCARPTMLWTVHVNVLATP